MTTIFILFIFVIQLITIYFIALLYMKMSKFDDLEKKQHNLMREMDDSIAVYLAELKDENDRLIEKLEIRNQNNTEEILKTPEQAAQSVPPSEVSEKLVQTPQINIPKRPINLAIKSYNETSLLTSASLEEVEVDDRTRTIRLYEAGHTIEGIAKMLEKGKTEVELILKFR